jgi:hypothetical protein
VQQVKVGILFANIKNSERRINGSIVNGQKKWTDYASKGTEARDIMMRLRRVCVHLGAENAR